MRTEDRTNNEKHKQIQNYYFKQNDSMKCKVNNLLDQITDKYF